MCSSETAACCSFAVSTLQGESEAHSLRVPNLMQRDNRPRFRGYQYYAKMGDPSFRRVAAAKLTSYAQKLR